MQYGTDKKLCKRGCRESYKESDEDHHYAYHVPKTVALVCGCGYGDIFVSRVRKHLLEAHNVRATKDEVVENYFWYRLPVYNTVRTCEDPRGVGCVFRTPIHELEHNCKTSMQRSPLPKPGRFIDYMRDARYVPLKGGATVEREKPNRSPSPKRSRAELSASGNEPNEKPTCSSAPSNVSGRVDSPRRGQPRRETSASRKDKPSASSYAKPMQTQVSAKPSAQPSRFEPRRKEETDSDEGSSGTEFSGSEHSADTREPGTRKPSSIYAEEEGVELHADEFSDFEVQFEDEKRTVKPRPKSEWWGDEPGQKKKEEPKSASASDKQDKDEKWTEVGAGGKPMQQKKERNRFEPDWDVFDKIDIPQPELSASTYAGRANLTREPPNCVMRGLMCYNTRHERTHNVHIYADTHLYEGIFVLINEEGLPFCYATVTPHVGSPYKTDSRWSQFNPLNYPCFAEMSDKRTKPNQTIYYACFSMNVAAGRFHMRILPRDDRATPIPIMFQRMGNFGKTAYVKYHDHN